MSNKKYAFTLIELLIVVAIIAILAAIAVPNFLEAQVRSKVSRAKADMRSIATAVEAYHTDWNHHPCFHYTTYTTHSDRYALGGTVTEWFVGGMVIPGGSGLTSPTFEGDYQLTSPQAYITNIPTDPFHIAEGDDPPDTRGFMYVNFKYGSDVVPGIFGDTVFRMYGDWRMSSGGPDKSRHDSFHISYDPTNGTISLGQIHRTQRNPEGHAVDPW